MAPFTEQQVGCKKAFKSNFMSEFLKDFLNGKISVNEIATGSMSENVLFGKNYGALRGVPAEGVGENGEAIVAEGGTSPTKFSIQAQDVYDAGLELWKYYHTQPKANPDASFYDIRKFFQGETKGRMNPSSDDETYTELIGDLRAKMKVLAKKIEIGVYKYGFLK